MCQTGIIFDISHYMLEDGPGIRTNVFLKGCPLRCRWCSNAYGLEGRIQLSYDRSRCTGCRKCLDVCEKNAISWDETERIVLQDFGSCADCLTCVRACPSKARKQIGRMMTADAVVREVERDRMFYRRGDGGVTLSGGEILLQRPFAAEILKKCQDEGINTSVETSGFGNWEDLKGILQYCDSAFIDCKCMNGDKHRELTGVSNEKILTNIRKAAEWCRSEGIRLIIRLPLIPGLNDDRENVRATAEFVGSLPGRPLLNVLPYHNFGAPKYALLGKTYEMGDLTLQGKAELAKVREWLDQTGVHYSVGGYDI